MTNINLAFHITGPTWAWAVLAIAATVYAFATSVKVAGEIWLYLAQRKHASDAIAKRLNPISR